MRLEPQFLPCVTQRLDWLAAGVGLKQDPSAWSAWAGRWFSGVAPHLSIPACQAVGVFMTRVGLPGRSQHLVVRHGWSNLVKGPDSNHARHGPLLNQAVQMSAPDRLQDEHEHKRLTTGS